MGGGTGGQGQQGQGDVWKNLRNRGCAGCRRRRILASSLYILYMCTFCICEDNDILLKPTDTNGM